MMLNASVTRLLLILKSRGESEERDGERLASRSHGFSSESIRTSKPRISKQFVLLVQCLLSPAWILSSALMIDLIITS